LEALELIDRAASGGITQDERAEAPRQQSPRRTPTGP